MKIILKLMGILVVCVNTNYAVNAVVLMASKGSVSYSHIKEIKVVQCQDRSSRALSIPMLSRSSDTNLDITETPGLVEPLASKPIRILLVAQNILSDDDEEALAPHSLPKNRWPSKNLGIRKASVLVGSSAEVFRLTESGAVVSNEDDILSMSKGAVQASKEDETLERSESPLSSTCSGLTTCTSSFINTDLQEDGSLSNFDDDDFFTSGGGGRRVSILTLETTSESPLWIPGEEITVTFTKNNTRETVMWGGRVEKQKKVSSLVLINPARYQTPMTPVNQVARRSIARPDSRTLDSRLREAAIGALFPIRLEVNPLTNEEVIKVMPRSKSPVRLQIET